MYKITIKFLVLCLLCNLCLCKSFNVSRNSEVSRNDEVKTDALDLDYLGRTLDSIGNIGGMLMNLTSSGSIFNYTIGPIFGGNSCAGSTDIGLFEAIKIPLYFIIPAIIIGVVILIKKIGLGVVWIPSITAPLLKSFMSLTGGGSDEQQGGYGYSPSPAYGAPAPSPVYGPGGASTLSRQTAILESIDNLNNQYSQPAVGNSEGNLNYYPASDAGSYQYNPADSNSQDYNSNNMYYYNNDKSNDVSSG